MDENEEKMQLKSVNVGNNTTVDASILTDGIFSFSIFFCFYAFMYNLSFFIYFACKYFLLGT